MHEESPATRDKSTEALLAELRRVYGRIDAANDGTASVIQSIMIVFGAGALIATQIPEAIVVIPLFWTVWLMYAIMVDANTMKYAVIAEHLEGLVNERLGVRGFVWESWMADRSHARPLIFWTNYMYWALLNGAAWLTAIVVLLHKKQAPAAIGVASVWGLTWIAGLMSTAFRRDAYRSRWRDRLQEAIAGSGTPDTSHSKEAPPDDVSHSSG